MDFKQPGSAASVCGSGHIVDRLGQCQRCGVVMGPFDLTAAIYHAQHGRAVRCRSWPEGDHVLLRGEKIARSGVVESLMTIEEVFGQWDLFTPSGDTP